MILKALFSKIWVWLIAAAGVALSVIGVIVSRTMKENSRLKRRVENAEARVNRARVVAQGDINATQNEQKRESEIADDLEHGRDSYDPNSLFDKDDS